MVIDAFTICIAYLLSWAYKFLILDGPHGLSFVQYCVVLIPIVPLYLTLYLAFNLYTSKRLQGRRLEGSNIIKANTIGLLLIMGTLFLLRSCQSECSAYLPSPSGTVL